MPFSAKGVTNLLLGTTTNRWATVVVHVVFWIVFYQWFVLEGSWLSDEAHPQATRLMTLNVALNAILSFYAVSYCLKQLRTSAWVWPAVVALLLVSFVAYCLSNYILYNYLNVTYPDMPTYFKRLVANISKEGPWTFLQSGVIYYDISRFLMIGFVPFLIKSVRELVQTRLHTVSLEKNNLKLELEFLRAQINPHFFFNTLNSVYSLVEDKDQTAATLVLSLSNMMRYAIYDSAIPEVDVAQELAFIQEYLDIQQIRHQRRLTIDVQIAPELGLQRIPPMLLVTFLENAVKHGVDKLLRHAWVRVQAYRDELGTFCFAVTNATPPADGAAPGEGIGLRNTRRRLSILYPDTHSLQIHRTDAQYHVLLRLWQ